MNREELAEKINFLLGEQQEEIKEIKNIVGEVLSKMESKE